MPTSRHGLIAFALLNCLAMAVSAADPPDWENEQVIHINTEAPRATFVPFADISGALNVQPKFSPFFLSLDGPWKFHWVPKPEDRPTNFFQADFDDSTWTNIDVPSNWEMKG